MVEDRESIYSNKAKNRNRPRLFYLWTVVDVQKWLKRHSTANDDYPLYATYVDIFHQHEITGRQLVRLNDTKLIRMGITNAEHRNHILKEIIKLKLKADVCEIRDMQLRQHIANIYDCNS